MTDRGARHDPTGPDSRARDRDQRDAGASPRRAQSPASTATQVERKRDTRKKILIGGAVLAAVAHEGVPAISSAADLLAWLAPRLTRPHDRAVFDLTPPRTR